MNLEEMLAFYLERWQGCAASVSQVQDIRARTGLYAQCRTQFEQMILLTRLTLAIERLLAIFEPEQEDNSWDKLAEEIALEQDRVSGQIVGERI